MYCFLCFYSEFVTCSISATGFLELINKYKYKYWQLPRLPLRFEEKLETKKLGAHQPRDFKLQQSGKNKNRSFSTSWFEEKIWLTVSEENK
jgi:hypothetical protein